MATQITRETGYRCVDQLDGKDLMEGEKLRMSWPDGSTEEVACQTERSSKYMQDGNAHFDLFTSLAYVDVPHRGLNARLYLFGLTAERLG